MGHATDFEYGDQFVFGSVKRSGRLAVLAGLARRPLTARRPVVTEIGILLL
jgi:hypothetical protein